MTSDESLSALCQWVATFLGENNPAVLSLMAAAAIASAEDNPDEPWLSLLCDALHNHMIGMENGS